MLRLEGVDAGYGATQVLWDVTLEAKEGATTVIVGPNGAGKSTTLKVVEGLLPVAKGTVTFQGTPINQVVKDRPVIQVPAYRRPEMGIASCPEGRRLFPLLSTETNLRLGAYTRRARDDAEETLAYVYRLFPRLEDRARVRVSRLSGGEQQMVGIGRALMAKPTVLLLDEPSLGLAPKTLSEIFDKIRELKGAGLTLLMVEQNAYQALKLADFGYVIQSGRVIRSGPPSELLDLEELRKAYFALT